MNYTTAQVALRFGITPTSVSRAVNNGHVIAHKVKGRWIFFADDLPKRWIWPRGRGGHGISLTERAIKRRLNTSTK